MKDAFLCRIDPAAWLTVRGPDAAVFLQGQFTNELRRTEANACTYGLWLNQKGRVLADSFVLARGPERFDVVSLSSPAAVIKERLEAYIIADDVSVEDFTTGARGWIVTGKDIPEPMIPNGLPLSLPGVFAERENFVGFRARAAGTANWYVASPTPTVEAADRPSVGDWSEFRVIAREELAVGRIAAGVPEVPVDVGPGDLPNEGGLEHEALSFTKGCYLGQEVMARLRSMGQVRRRLFVVSAPRDAGPIATGAALFSGDRRVGEIRSYARSGDTIFALAMLHTSHVAGGEELTLEPGGTTRITVGELATGKAP